MHGKVILCSFLIITTLLATSGCTILAPQPVPTPVPTPLPTTDVPTTVKTMATPVPTPTASTKPGPTQTMPAQWPLSISVEKAGTYSKTIITHFDGGKGMASVVWLHSRVTRPDGTVTQESIERPGMGDVIEIEGTGGADRIEVEVVMTSGQTYKVIDQQMTYKTRY